MVNQTRDWTFLSSPQFSVIVATVVVLVAGAMMYDRLDSKVDALRTDGSSGLDRAVDKIDRSLDKFDTKIQVLSQKIDDGNREIRMILQARPAPVAHSSD